MEDCAECGTQAITQWRENGGVIYLCEACTIRFVRVTPVRGMLLAIETFDKARLSAPPPDPMQPPIPPEHLLLAGLIQRQT